MECGRKSGSAPPTRPETGRIWKERFDIPAAPARLVNRLVILVGFHPLSATSMDMSTLLKMNSDKMARTCRLNEAKAEVMNQPYRETNF